MRIEQNHITEFLTYVLNNEKKSLRENPIQEDNERHVLLEKANKKLTEVAEKSIRGMPNEN